MTIRTGKLALACMLVAHAVALPANAPQPEYATTITTTIGGTPTTITATIDPPTWPWPPISEPTSTPAVVNPQPEWVTTFTTSASGHATTFTITYDSPIPTYITTTGADGQPTTLMSTITPALPPFTLPLPPGVSAVVTTIDGKATTVFQGGKPPETTTATVVTTLPTVEPSSATPPGAGTTTCLT